ncbi:unnamed protein product [Brassicogethes aeneus]|uniref:NADP-dependent oxidoreductase domain-containing protein n=1 Tax=Brassicogethes aeneus TaxID=1431903 RepID=A0A9P0BAI4_BRAAE|nr:unnamed protein product [Brassicogethes aeneus]
MAWCVVFFPDDKTYEVIPNSWILEEKESYFPNIQGFRLYEIIKKRQSPDDDWNIFSVKILGQYDDFTVAQSQCEAARRGEDLTKRADIKSDSITKGGKGSRVRKPNSKFNEFTNINTDDDELNKVNLTLPELKRKGNEVSTLAMCDSENNTIVIENEVDSYSNNAVLVENVSLILQKLDELDAKQEEFQRRMFRQQFIIENKIRDVENKLDKINVLNVPPNQDNRDYEDDQLLEMWNLFPLDNNEKIETMESALLDKNLFKSLARKFSLVGGETPKDITRSILYLMLTNEMAAMYSFDGAKGKLKFKSLKLFELLLASIRKNPKTTNATENEILPELRQWLAQAKFRKKNSDGYSDTDYLETWQGMEECHKAGLAKNIGVSNFNIDQLERLSANCQIQPAVNQIEVNPNLTQVELRKFCKEKNIAVTAFCPLGRNLAAPSATGQPVSATNDPEVAKIAQKYNKTTAQVVLRFLVEMGISVIPKSVNKGRIAQNIDIFDFSLTEEETNYLNSLNKNIRVSPMNNYKDHKFYPFER